MPDFLELAKKGNTNAIEVLMNKSFGSEGVVVHIASVGSTLKVTLKTPSEPGPDKNLAGRVNAGLRKIGPKGFDKAFIAAKTMKSDKTIWSVQLGLKPDVENVETTSPQALKNHKKTGDFEMDMNLEGPRKWVALALLGAIGVMGVGWWWVIDSNTPKVSKSDKTSLSAIATPLAGPKEDQVAQQEIQANAEELESETAAASPPGETEEHRRIIIAPSSSENFRKTRATAQEVEDFRELVTLLDPEKVVITQIQQYSDTELLYLTVTPTFIRENKVNQGDLAISLRDAWNKTCDCYGQLLFQSPGGQQLIHISALGEPKFKQE